MWKLVGRHYTDSDIMILSTAVERDRPSTEPHRPIGSYILMSPVFCIVPFSLLSVPLSAAEHPTTYPSCSMSAVEEELRPLLAALQVLRSSSNRQQKEKAHNYLEAFQKKVRNTLVSSESVTNVPLSFRVRHGLPYSVYSNEIRRLGLKSKFLPHKPCVPRSLDVLRGSR